MTVKTGKLATFLRHNLAHMSRGMSQTHGAQPNRPFERCPRDYLDYAEERMRGKKPNDRVDCIANLKRAMDCQLQCFLAYYGVDDYFEIAGASLRDKLDFISSVKVFPSRTLKRIVAIRNKAEHAFSDVDVSDLELDTFFDLATAFVSVLEATTLVAPRNQRIEFLIRGVKNCGAFNLSYEDGGRPSEEEVREQEREMAALLDIELPETAHSVQSEAKCTDAVEQPDGIPVPSITFEFHMNSREPEGIRAEAKTQEFDDFKYFFRAYVLLCYRDAFLSDAYIRSRLDPLR